MKGILYTTEQKVIEVDLGDNDSCREKIRNIFAPAYNLVQINITPTEIMIYATDVDGVTGTAGYIAKSDSKKEQASVSDRDYFFLPAMFLRREEPPKKNLVDFRKNDFYKLLNLSYDNGAKKIVFFDENGKKKPNPSSEEAEFERSYKDDFNNY